MQIKTVTEVLTDGSKVYNVLLIQDDQIIRLPAYDQKHAKYLDTAISEAVESFSAELVV